MPRPSTQTKRADFYGNPRSTEAGGSAATWKEGSTSIDLPVDAPSAILAVGAETKGTFCIANARKAWLSRDFGVLTVPGVFREYRRSIDQATCDLGIDVRVIARDLHPGYVSTEFAAGHEADQCVVQHHHAHIASCMAENGIDSPVIGICCDGAGCGPDKASWGCEVLQVSPSDFQRLAHLRYYGLPGGDAAATQCWRPALSVARIAFGDTLPQRVERLFADVDAADRSIAERMLSRDVQCPKTSSLGRLFDAVAFLLDIRRTNSHEGQAAQALESLAGSLPGECLEIGIQTNGPVTQLDFGPAVGELHRRQMQGVPPGQLAADFHETVASMLARMAISEANKRDIAAVAVSGGCLANRILAQRLDELLEGAGLAVARHRRVPCGDAGLAVGQVFVAAARMRAAMAKE